MEQCTTHVRHSCLGSRRLWCLLFLLGAPAIGLRAAPSKDTALVPDTTLAIPALHFDSTGALVLRPYLRLGRRTALTFPLLSPPQKN
jgi:hypothetical protein